MEVGRFSEKLNKIDGVVYVIEEKVSVTNGVYEAELRHDNIAEGTLAIYTGSKLTGERITNYALSTPSNAPWKRIIRIYADVPTVYITYETPGDTVEADDINRVQISILTTQEAVNAEEGRARVAEAELHGIIEANKPMWDDKYTRNEVDNKFSVFETAIDWKEAVGTYDDLAAAYPTPEDGWTVNVKDTDYTYRWNGSEWVVISANAIPKATQAIDGLLSHEDKAAYDDANLKKHTHDNKTVLDAVTQDDMDKLDSIAKGAQVNVQPDWNVTDTASDAFIRNKPSALWADGGNADTVNAHTVEADVPSDAVFTDTTYAAFSGATAEHAGEDGLVPAPAAGMQESFLCADGTWKEPPSARGDLVRKAPTWDELMGR